jgi:DNA repair exonuclease SbcCD nuclease subunit
MRIVHTADVHLREARGERWEALEAVVALAREQAADVLVVAGDLFDRDVDAQALRPRLRGLFERFAGAVLVLPGNHDAAGFRKGDFFGGNVRVLAGQPEDVDDTRFVGLPFEELGLERTLERLHEAATQCRADAVNVLVYHGELLGVAAAAGAFGEEPGSDYMPVRLESFDGLGFDYVLAGHFHSAFRVLPCGATYFVYPGSPIAITRRETGRRRVSLVDTGTPPRPLDLDTPHFEPVRIRLEPEAETHPLERVKETLAGLHPSARALLEVSGFVDLASIALTEELFAGALARVASEFDAEVESKWRDVHDILDGELFRRCARKLEASDLDADDRVRVRDALIVALMEVEHAR